MTVHYYKLNQAVILIVATVPGAVFLLEQISTAPGTWYTATDMDNAVFSILTHKNHQKQLAFT